MCSNGQRPRCRRLAVGALATWAVALPTFAEGMRTQAALSASALVQAEEGFDYDVVGSLPEPLQEAWATLGVYVNKQNFFKMFEVFTLYINMKKVASLRGPKRSAASFAVTGEIFTSLEALMEVDEKFSEVLGIKSGEDNSSAWSCDDYAAVPPKLSFTATSLYFPLRTFDSGDKQCLTVVENHMNVVRWGICWLEKLAGTWAQEVERDARNPAFFGEMYVFDSDKVCVGDKLDSKLLSRRFKDIIDVGIDGRMCVADKESLRSQDCAAECSRIEECTAVTHDAKRRRCCFYSGEVEERPAAAATRRWRNLFGLTSAPLSEERCLAFGARDRFLALSKSGLGAWLRDRGFGHLEASAAGAFGGTGLNGLSISFVTAPLLKRWLSTDGGAALSDDQAAELRCRVDAELANEPERDCSPRHASMKKKSAPASASTASTSTANASGGGDAASASNSSSGVASTRSKLKAFMPAFRESMILRVNSKKMYGIAKLAMEGTDSLEAFVFVRAATAMSGFLKFHDMVMMNTCQNVKKHLDLVVDQLMAGPVSSSTQMGHVRARIAHGM